MKIYYNVPMARHTSFGIGGPARIFIEAQSTEDIVNVVKARSEREPPLTVLGAGSNALVSDGGIDTAVLYIGRGFARAEADGDIIRADAGALISKIALTAERAGLTGFEWAAHIPGTLGGALFMNAGAYGSDMAGVTQSVSAAGRDGKIWEYTAAECGFSYRNSAFQRTGETVTGAALKLRRGRAEDIRRLTEEYLMMRKSSQPYGQRSAGSVFKAADGVPAARYIDALGLKGFRIGGAEISEKHANFIVNTGGAACADVLKLIEYIKERVFNAYGVNLETEIRLL